MGTYKEIEEESGLGQSTFKKTLKKCLYKESNKKCTDSCPCGHVNDSKHLLTKFEKLQKAINPKKDCKDAFHEAYNYLIGSGGMISKVMVRGENKPFGFLVRIPSISNPDIVFLRFFRANSNCKNTYFQKLTAIVSTVINGEKFIKDREETGQWIDDIPFEIYYKTTENVINFPEGDVAIVDSIENAKFNYVRGRAINDIKYNCYLLDDEVISYINGFEDKARNYYKENGKNKTFVALPFY